MEKNEIGEEDQSTRQKKTKSTIDFSNINLKYQVGRFLCEEQPAPFDVFTLEQCHEFYTDDITEKVLIPLITKTHKVSLRSLDWLATNYSKKYHLVYINNNGCNGNNCSDEDCHHNLVDKKTPININRHYASALRRNHRKKFDPFRRRTRVYFQHNGVWYETTVGQLRFLRWMHIYGVLDYAEKHLDEINRDMSATNDLNKKNKEEAIAKGLPIKRRPLSNRPNVLCVAYKTPI